MQTIQLPDEQFQRLASLAQAAGYGDVDGLLASLAAEPIEDPRGLLTEEQLRESVARMEQGEADIEAGKGREMKDALNEIADKYGLKIN